MEKTYRQGSFDGAIGQAGLAFRLWWVVATTLAGSVSYFVAGAIVSLRAQSDKLGQLYGGSNFMTGDNAAASALLWGFYFWS